DRAVTYQIDQALASGLFERNQREFYRLLDKLPAGAYVCDAEGLITYFNHRAVVVWGREPKLRDPDDRFCGSLRLYKTDGTAIPHEKCWMALSIRERRAYNGHEIVMEDESGQRVTV